jgi:hypothetical protein
MQATDPTDLGHEPVVRGFPPDAECSRRLSARGSHTAREMDVAILQYAEVAGGDPAGSLWAEPEAEPFQAPA